MVIFYDLIKMLCFIILEVYELIKVNIEEKFDFF